MPAVKDIWILGDRFILDNFHEVTDLITEAKMAKRDEPYVTRFYNVKSFHPDALANRKNFSLRYADTLNRAVNECIRLPRFVIIMMDADFLRELCNLCHGYVEPNQMEFDIKKTINWVVNLTTRTINTLKTDMYYKKPGCATASEPKFIWTKILQ